MKNFKERCAELGIILKNPKSKKFSTHRFLECIPAKWPKCNKLKVPTLDILKTCKNRKFFYRPYKRKYWCIKCAMCKTKNRVIPFKTDTNYQKIY